ncbi:FAD-dependent oxidoreductase [Spirillospora sp. CA-294931]|uniref:FAD-dependent oxidoreductase n=1 Tax=Spirillospora sp. CA-294931 TaxID=3240042 RepID=UPI003D8A7F25
MAFAITQNCCNDASCVSVCPVNCIHPTPDDPGFATAEMLYIDPKACIDCGACADACPVDAILPIDQLTGPDAPYARINAQYYEAHEIDHSWGLPTFPRSLPRGIGTLRVAIVGTGPAASYAAQSLLRSTGAEVTMIDRVPVPGGLIRFGVAPDHPSTRKAADGFASLYQHPRLSVHMNVEAGRDISHEEIAAHHHAVIYAVGAANDRALGVPGEDRPASVSATRFVSWYNAHPDVPADAVDLSAERAVVIGNGNVALDVARLLLTDPEDLAGTDIADHALDALRASGVREVVLLGRRGPADAAYSRPEFLALRGLNLVVDDRPGVREEIASAAPSSKAALLDGLPIEPVDWSAPGERRLVLRFHSSPIEFTGDPRLTSVRVTGERGTIPAGLAVRSIGYRGAPVDGLPFDPSTGTVPHRAGRVSDGTYVVGWIKRGPSGGIGANRTCAEETVGTLIDDAAAGRLPAPPGGARAFARLVRRRSPRAIGLKQMLAIDAAERRRGREAGRPRVKFPTVPEMLAAAKR